MWNRKGVRFEQFENRLNLSGIGFEQHNSESPQGFPPGFLIVQGVADLDDDERPDVLVSEESEGSLTLSTYSLVGQQFIRQDEIATVDGLSETVVFDDFNADGRVDIVIGGVDEFLWLVNQGNNQFEIASVVDSPTSLRPTRIVSVDFDLDGDQDLVTLAQNPDFYRSITVCCGSCRILRIGEARCMREIFTSKFLGLNRLGLLRM